MKTDLEIMKIRLTAYNNIANKTKQKWWVDLFIKNKNKRSTEELIFRELPHKRITNLTN